MNKDCRLNIVKVDKLPSYIEENNNEYWDYPISELDYLLEQIKDGDRENNYKLLLYNNRLYECEQE